MARVVRDICEALAFWAFVYYEVRELAPRKGERRVFLPGDEQIDASEALRRCRKGAAHARLLQAWRAT